jgi:hypothetical protein
MFDWRLMLLLTAVCIPGIVAAVPKTIQALERKLERLRESRRSTEGRQLPSNTVIVILQIAQSVVLLLGVSALGIVLSPKTGLGAPFFEALTSGGGAVEALKMQVLPALGAGAAGAVLFLLLYYLVFRRIMDAESVAAMEGLRGRVGLAGRILYGGVVEEVITRWGVMNLVVWLLSLAFGAPTPAALWIGLFLTGLLFGAGHLPAYLQVGCRKTPAVFAAMFTLNLWGAVIFGWLYMRYGLAAAMIAHALFHLMWYPLDLAFARGRAAGRSAAPPTPSYGS